MNIFTFNRKKSDSEAIISGCLKSLINRISDDLERKGYYWDKSWGVKRYESFILAKFILDYSFEGVMKDEISDEEKKAYYYLSNNSLLNRFNMEFSEVGMNYEDMKDEINSKIKKYFIALSDDSQPPECYHQIYSIVTGNQSVTVLNDEINKHTVCIQFLKVNNNFSHLVPNYEEQLNFLKKQVSAFGLAEIMLPHMIRSARHEMRNLSIKKLKSLSKKLAKKDKQ